MKQYYFISGLPRSGSTLLSSILRQNPNFHAGVSTNLLSYVRSIIEAGSDGNKSVIDPQRTKRIMMSAVDSFYQNIERNIVFDTNRLWTNLLPQLRDCFPYTKVICCVRDINWIIDSFDRLHQKNPYLVSTVFPPSVDMHVYSRSSSLMADAGIVKTPYDSLKSAICGMHSDMLFLLEYELLCKNPEGCMKAIYNFIDQPYFQHNFDNVEISFDEFDKEVNMRGLHTTRKKVEWIERKHILPPDILSLYKDMEVWRYNR